MTELHNMSVPSRTHLTVRREHLPGRRYRLDLWTPIARLAPSADATAVMRRIRRDSGVYLLGLIEGPVSAKARRDKAGVAARLRQRCLEELGRLRLPDGFGFFVAEPDDRADRAVPAAAAIAILAARSGPLYLPGRFEPSLITFHPVTLFFPFMPGESADPEDGGVR
jgi:hypothetical protein